jgi:hypothetical protein
VNHTITFRKKHRNFVKYLKCTNRKYSDTLDPGEEEFYAFWVVDGAMPDRSMKFREEFLYCSGALK